MQSNEIIFAIGVNFDNRIYEENPEEAPGYDGQLRDICIMNYGPNLENSQTAFEGMEFFLDYSGIEKAAQHLKTGVYKATFDIKVKDDLDEDFCNITFQPLYVLCELPEEHGKET